eukprot:CAMPEP_0174240922 /NCGR_PEP_ID=MMETSP0417-20130205/21136_1 /TAXON_ID=242541 /ORGANISM="Mayorella sp, Strain BSH-02190019" /LENGTH=714 /DNA_ID=CAMNT_0015320093 /DNA_START=31 /DNA_END=2172 /DNA_ORIENTATION=+
MALVASFPGEESFLFSGTLTGEPDNALLDNLSLQNDLFVAEHGAPSSHLKAGGQQTLSSSESCSTSGLSDSLLDASLDHADASAFGALDFGHDALLSYGAADATQSTAFFAMTNDERSADAQRSPLQTITDPTVHSPQGASLMHSPPGDTFPETTEYAFYEGSTHSHPTLVSSSLPHPSSSQRTASVKCESPTLAQPVQQQQQQQHTSAFASSPPCSTSPYLEGGFCARLSAKRPQRTQASSGGGKPKASMDCSGVDVEAETTLDSYRGVRRMILNDDNDADLENDDDDDESMEENDEQQQQQQQHSSDDGIEDGGTSRAQRLASSLGLHQCTSLSGAAYSRASPPGTTHAASLSSPPSATARSRKRKSDPEIDQQLRQLALQGVIGLPRDSLLQVSSVEYQAYMDTLKAHHQLEADKRRLLSSQRRQIKNREYAQKSRKKAKMARANSGATVKAILAENVRLRSENEELKEEVMRLRLLVPSQQALPRDPELFPSCSSSAPAPTPAPASAASGNGIGASPVSLWNPFTSSLGSESSGGFFASVSERLSSPFSIGTTLLSGEQAAELQGAHRRVGGTLMLAVLFSFGLFFGLLPSGPTTSAELGLQTTASEVHNSRVLLDTSLSDEHLLSPASASASFLFYLLCAAALTFTLFMVTWTTASLRARRRERRQTPLPVDAPTAADRRHHRQNATDTATSATLHSTTTSNAATLDEN